LRNDHTAAPLDSDSSGGAIIEVSAQNNAYDARAKSNSRAAKQCIDCRPVSIFQGTADQAHAAGFEYKMAIGRRYVDAPVLYRRAVFR
jgi:hypothetical protein